MLCTNIYTYTYYVVLKKCDLNKKIPKNLVCFFVFNISKI